MSDDPTPPEGGSKEFAPITSQADLDRIIGQRLAREQQKYADYDDVKAKAVKYDQAQAAQQTAEQRAEAAQAALTAENGDLKAQVARLNAVIAHNLTAEDAAALEGIPADKVDALAARLAAKAGETAKPPAATRRPPKSGVTPGDQTTGKERAAAALRGLADGGIRR